jgi:hypothetical protein
MKSEVNASIVYQYILDFVRSAILRLVTDAAATSQATFIRKRQNDEYNWET